MSPQKPKKPRPDFPLFAHSVGQWAKKIKGKMYYFGVWADPDAALKKYVEQKDALQAGLPVDRPGDLKIVDLADSFLDFKSGIVSTGELSNRTFVGYRRTCQNVVDILGKSKTVEAMRAEDFQKLRERLANGRGLVALKNQMIHARMMFRHATDAGLTKVAIPYEKWLSIPSRKNLRKERSSKPNREFTAEQIREILKLASVPLKAMTLLAINCGWGQTDMALLQKSHIKSGWAEYPRPKTEIPRRCPLWAETLDAVRMAIANRPEPNNPEHQGNIFITCYGNLWVTFSEKGTSIDSVSLEFKKLMRKSGIVQRGLNFYALRHTFQTVADEAKDPVATQSIMGHAPDGNDMGAVYRERVSDDRLIAVTEHVRKWLTG